MLSAKASHLFSHTPTSSGKAPPSPVKVLSSLFHHPPVPPRLPAPLSLTFVSSTAPGSRQTIHRLLPDSVDYRPLIPAVCPRIRFLLLAQTNERQVSFITKTNEHPTSSSHAEKLRRETKLDDRSPATTKKNDVTFSHSLVRITRVRTSFPLPHARPNSIELPRRRYHCSAPTQFCFTP